MIETAALFPTQVKAPPPRTSPKPVMPVKAKTYRPTKKDAVIVCQDNLAFMQSLPEASIKLIVTSPYYNLGKPNETTSSLDEYVKAQHATITLQPDLVRVAARKSKPNLGTPKHS